MEDDETKEIYLPGLQAKEWCWYRLWHAVWRIGRDERSPWSGIGGVLHWDRLLDGAVLHPLSAWVAH